jgi:plasmid stabilization system protein ParE
MVEIRWTEQAADDLEFATQYIAVDSPHFASLFAIKIVSSIDRLAISHG